MNGISTITQKGQVVVPKPIRELLHLQPSMRVYFEVKNDTVMIKPALSIDQAMGMIKTKKKAIQKDYDQAIKKAIMEKFSKL